MGGKMKTLLSWVVAIVVIILVVIGLVSLANVMSGVTSFPDWTGFNQKTLWDFVKDFSGMIILIILIYAFFQDRSQGRKAAEKAREERRQELAMARDQAREAVLETYLDQMKELLIDKGLRRAEPTDEVSVIARTLTLASMARLDGKRNGTLLRFLTEAIGLSKESPVYLAYADLSQVDLRGAFIPEIDLSEARLVGADLSGAILTEADLTRSYLHQAKLSGADLNGADLRGAILTEADLSRAYLHQAKLNGANLTGVSFNSRTTWPDDFDPVKAGAVKVVT
jgi:hypothetical protein